MEIELVVLKLIEHLNKCNIKSNCKISPEMVLALLIAMYFFSAKFSFPLRL